jgi:hypothetical protein
MISPFSLEKASAHMLSALHSSRRLAASFTVYVVLFGLLAPVSASQAAPILAPKQADFTIQTPETLTLDKAPVLLAHHEGSIGATQLLTTGVSATGASLTKSLWGNMILSMAIQQDTEIQQVSKKLGKISGYVFANVGLTSVLSLAQSIDGIVTLQEDPHPYHPPVLGLIASGLSVLGVTTQAAMTHHYKKQLLARQDALADEVSHILGHLKSDGVSDHVTAELTSLIGDEATQEFIQLWTSAHR